MSWLESPTKSLVVQGCDIRYRRLGTPGGAPVVLLHGGGGHAGWWLDVAPQLARTHDVVVVELSGHGDSGHRAAYSPMLWVEDTAAVIEEIGAGAAHVVGHSMGGLVALHVAGRRPRSVRSVTVVDSAVVRKPGTEGPKPGRLKFYPSLDEALANFRLRPRATTASPRTLAVVARAGLREEPAGWRWKFDPAAMRRMPREELEESIRRITCPVGFLYGERSELVDAWTVDQLAGMLGRDVERMAVPGAYHHVPIDAPAETVAGIESMIADGVLGRR
jgi:pimeloyl-ACP methyl ester carboxylesterase